MNFRKSCATLIFAAFSILLSGNIVDAWVNNNGTAIQSTTSGVKTNHGDQGIRKMARIGDVIIVSTTGTGTTSGTDYIYQSTNGTTWNTIGSLTSAMRGSVLSGPGNTFYAFWIRSGSTPGIYRSKWDASVTTLPTPTMIVTGYTTSVSDGEHQHITSAIDESGDLYVAWHGSLDGSSRDQVYLIRSTDGGTTWTSPVAMTSGTNGYILPDLMVDHSNKVHLIYADDWDAPPVTASRRVYYRSSTDGVTWSDATIPDNGSTGASFSNISIIESKNNNLFIFGQRSKTSNCGLAFSKSTNGGISWSAFALADYPTAVGCAQGYADPSAAIGSDGTIYTVSRNDRYADGSTITCNEYPCWTNVVNMSTDEGVTWSRAETNRINNTRMWTSNSLRYQTWWNYGGQLEWVWHQGVDASNQATYYDSNPGVPIFNIMNP